MRIAFFEIKPWERDYLRKKLRNHKLSFYEDVLSQKNIKNAQSCDVISIFIYSKIDKQILSKLPKLKLIATRSTGFDHIDIEECRNRRISVCNVPFYGENTVAEHTFALILSLSRNVHKAYMKTLRHNFSMDGLEGFDLKGKTLGVIGAGHIGQHVIRIAKGFGMNVFAYDINQDRFLAEVLGFEYVPLEYLLKNSDIITLHLPYNKATHHMINNETFKITKRGAILINTSRGAIVDTEALIEALDRKILSGAGIDVLEGEELIKEEKQLLHDNTKIEAFGNLVKDYILLGKDNVVFTPHIAFYSREALERILDTTLQNITSFVLGKSINLV